MRDQKYSASTFTSLDTYFGVDRMDPAGFEFLHDTYNLIENLEQLTEFWAVEGASAASRHDRLLQFSFRLLGDNIRLLPLASTLVAHVMSDECSPAHRRRADAFWDGVDREFCRYKPSFATTLQKFITYFCAARLLDFEVPGSQHLHQKIDDVLDDVLDHNKYGNQANYIQLIGEASRYAAQYPSAESQLSMHVGTQTDNLAKGMDVKKYTRPYAAGCARRLMMISSGIAIGLPNGSGLEEPLIGYFETSLKSMFDFDRKAASERLSDLFKSCEEQRKPSNRAFAACIRRKIEDFNNTAPRKPDFVTARRPFSAHNRYLTSAVAVVVRGLHPQPK